MRDLILSKVKEWHLESPSYGQYLDGAHDRQERHAEIMRAIDRACDLILLSVYTRLVKGDDVVIVSVDADGNYADLLFRGRIYGGMTSDGATHT